MDKTEQLYGTTLAGTEPVGWGWRGLLLGIWLVASFGGMYFVRDLERVHILGWPLGYWLAAQGLIIGYVCLVAFYAWLANGRERQQQPVLQEATAGEEGA